MSFDIFPSEHYLPGLQGNLVRQKRMRSITSCVFGANNDVFIVPFSFAGTLFDNAFFSSLAPRTQHTLPSCCNKADPKR